MRMFEIGGFSDGDRKVNVAAWGNGRLDIVMSLVSLRLMVAIMSIWDDPFPIGLDAKDSMM